MPEKPPPAGGRKARRLSERRRARLASLAVIVVVGLAVLAWRGAEGRGRHRSTSAGSTTVSTATTPPSKVTIAAPLRTNPLAAPAPAGPLALGPGVHVISRVPVPAGSRVVFLTIDDGLVRNPEFTARFIAAHVPVTIFPVATAEQEDAPFFKEWLAHGADLGDHTITHPNLVRLGQAAQTHEICGAADIAQKVLGRRPLLFRPPYGNHNATTAAAMPSCGIRYIILWREAVNVGQVQFQIGDHLQPGDIILMHFRTTFDEDFDAALAKVRDDGMQLGLLRDYLPS